MRRYIKGRMGESLRRDATRARHYDDPSLSTDVKRLLEQVKRPRLPRVRTVEREERTKVAKTLAAVTLARTVWEMGKGVQAWYIDRTQYQATISEASSIFPALLEYLNFVTDGKYVKFVVDYHRGVLRQYSGKGENTLTLDGHKVKFSVAAPNVVNSAGGGTTLESDGLESGMEVFAKKIVFTAHSQEGIDAVHRLLERLHDESKEKPRKPRHYYVSRYGWESIKSHQREWDSVFLPEGMAEFIEEDVNKFLDMEDRYIAMGQPWHRGYLLHGVPGNGKSSLAGALATKFEFNLYDMQLSGIKDDADLIEKFSAVDSRSVLLLEDVDIFSKTRSREDKDAETQALESATSGPTLQGLLNCLDGISTPHGLIVVMTTNHIDSLDEALIRKGRASVRLELPEPSAYQIANFFQHVYDEPLGVQPRQFKCMADVAEVFKTNPESAEQARIQLK